MDMEMLRVIIVVVIFEGVCLFSIIDDIREKRKKRQKRCVNSN